MPTSTANASVQDGTSVAQAILGGFHADRVAWAFLSGYQAAIASMFPGHDPLCVASFSVTEASGNRPRDINTRVEPLGADQLQLTGSKSWVAGGSACDQLLVAAVLKTPAKATGSGKGSGDGAVQWPQIRMLKVPANLPGVHFQAARPQAFVPELPHTGVDFDAVLLPASALVDGDGYAGFVKPFRSAEDTHIAIAMLAYLIRSGRQYQWPQDALEQMVGLMAGLSSAASMGFDQPATHIVLGGLLPGLAQVYERADLLWTDTLQSAGSSVEPEVERWRRDSRLFGMAKNVQQQRLKRAWEQISPVTSPGTGDGKPG